MEQKNINNELQKLIIQKIREKGKITFRDFMEMALYHPELGYYSKAGTKAGKSGDFYTAPCIHPAFGELVGRALFDMWLKMGGPSMFTVIEGGAGAGFLALDILKYLKLRHKDFYDSMVYIMSDLYGNRVVREIVTQELMPFVASQKVRVLEGDSAYARFPQFIGCYLSNELVDAFPVHRIVIRKNVVREIYTTVCGGGNEGGRDFTEVLDEPSTPDIYSYVSKYGDCQNQDNIMEINLKALDWIENVNRSLERGFILTIDYGGKREDIYSDIFPDGTLLSFSRHTAHSGVYGNIGCRDITAHVNFTALMRKGEELGLEVADYTDQVSFLTGLGLVEMIADKSRKHATDELLKMKNLLMPGGMGTAHKVLLQKKG